MSTLIPGRTRTTESRIPFVMFLLIFVLAGLRGTAQDGDCAACAVFPSLTVYHTIQNGPGNGIGFEAGTWKKAPESVSFFFGSSLVWQAAQSETEKTGPGSAYKPVNMTMYVKGQVALGNKLYAVVQPGIQNLSLFTLKTGLRYVIPLSNKVGIGLEPNYSVFQNVLAFNTNLHIALR